MEALIDSKIQQIRAAELILDGKALIEVVKERNYESRLDYLDKKILLSSQNAASMFESLASKINASLEGNNRNYAQLEEMRVRYD